MIIIIFANTSQIKCLQLKVMLLCNKDLCDLIKSSLSFKFELSGTFSNDGKIRRENKLVTNKYVQIEINQILPTFASVILDISTVG